MWRYAFRQKTPEAPLKTHEPEPTSCDAKDLDADKILRPEYFTAGSYAGLSRQSDRRLRGWVESEINRVGLPQWLCSKIVRLVVIAINQGSSTAGQALNHDPGIDEHYHFAINAILKSIPPSV